MSPDFAYLKKSESETQKINATPAPREIFLGYTRGGYELLDAIAEYIDNSIQQAGTISDPTKVKITITVGFDGPKCFVRIVDNAGGCSRVDATRFITPGHTGVNPLENGISRFGLGGKAAGLSIAEKVIVHSKAVRDQGFMVLLDKEELLSKEDWMFDIRDVPINEDIKEGETIIYLYGVDNRAHAWFPNEYKFKFGERYGLLLRSNEPKIFLDKEELLPIDLYQEMLNEDEAPGGCEPQIYIEDKYYQIKNNEGGTERVRVRLKATIGLLPARSTIGQYGAHIYCNQRLLQKNCLLGLIEASPITVHRTIHPTVNEAWIRAIVEVIGPAEMMPWTNRKDNLDPSTQTYNDLYEFLRKAYNEFNERIDKQREDLRRKNGTKEFPDINQVLTVNYRKKIPTGKLKPRTTRKLITKSHAYRKALEPIPSEQIPSPPQKRQNQTLSASVEAWKVKEVKKLIRENYGKDDVRNTDVVRTLLEHYLKCVGQKKDEKKEDE